MTEGNVASFFNAADWVAKWEAEGGALHVRFHAGTRNVFGVRLIIPVPRSCWVRGLENVFVGIPGPQMPEDKFDMFSALARRVDDAGTYNALLVLMQARVDNGDPVQEWSGYTNDM